LKNNGLKWRKAQVLISILHIIFGLWLKKVNNSALGHENAENHRSNDGDENHRDTLEEMLEQTTNF